MCWGPVGKGLECVTCASTIDKKDANRKKSQRWRRKKPKSVVILVKLVRRMVKWNILKWLSKLISRVIR